MPAVLLHSRGRGLQRAELLLQHPRTRHLPCQGATICGGHVPGSLFVPGKAAAGAHLGLLREGDVGIKSTLAKGRVYTDNGGNGCVERLVVEVRPVDL